jgi:hypothetical protein
MCALREAIVHRVHAGERPPFRPISIAEDGEIHPAMETLMQQCWAEQPNERPSFDDVTKTLRAINNGK